MADTSDKSKGLGAHVRYKREETYGTAPALEHGPLPVSNVGIELHRSKYGEHKVVGEIRARIECPCCKSGITIELHIDQPL